MPTDVPAVAPEDVLASGREEESLFARDDNDVLVRREKETRERFQDIVTVVLDGYAVDVPRAVPKTDALGNPLRDTDGGLVPRTTTIYDAALQLVAQGVWTEDDLKARIPVLCHQRHVAPVAVCRMCSVQISSMKRGKLTPGRKLVPACQHRVETNMVVTTRAGVDGYNPETRDKADMKAVERFSADVNGSVKLLAEFLMADHAHPDLGSAKRYDNELGAVFVTLGVDRVRKRLERAPELPSRNTAAAREPANPFDPLLAPSPKPRHLSLPLAPDGHEPERAGGSGAHQAWEDWNARVHDGYPYSSRTVVVDHDKCILCDRCVRACSEVKPFKVIGHTGKGYGTRISFDLDAIMGQSNCVQCGECMTSCPTGALSLRRRVQPRAWADSPTQIPVNPNTPFPADSGFLTADEIQRVWLRYVSPTRGPRVVFPFQSVPYAYLKWNEGAVRKWEIAPGEKKVLCEEGQYGSTAFMLQGSGTFEIYSRIEGTSQAKPGFFARLFGGGKPKGESGFGPLVRVATGDELVLGEMTCLTHRPRTASVIAVADPNNPSLTLSSDAHGRYTATLDPRTPGPVVVYEVTRNMLDMMLRSASARDDLQEMYTFRAIQACVTGGDLCKPLNAEQRERATMLLLTEGAEFRRVEAGDGIVAEGDPASDFYMVRLGTVRVFTTIGGREQVLRLLSAGDHFGEGALLADRPGMRSASVAALDPVELVRVPGTVFRKLIDAFPVLRESLGAAARPAVAGVKHATTPGVLSEYVRQGLYQGQRLLVLDLQSCTRCDECTRACADSHDGNARLLREGLRFGDFLVATSCRSCHKPYCMEGCPVDAIHRRGQHLEVVIENHCIGCGLCERNCPYGSIHMVAREQPNPAAASHPTGNPLMTAARRAVNCDLCKGEEPFCVQACPHVAAHRMTGPDLLDEVLERLGRPVA
ncbi:cyclic nucleotide-binding protein : Cyclic nucleotide-binding domain (CNMP-BD) protein OS=Rhodopirellula sp. SWK7 GN=RRSWK_03149 PE=4 SV=1: Fer2_4: Fer4_9: cNMP_binding: Fer4_7 [Gemmataceae bacterium]|nr:cyclic nucleotide-binding protein : Cyclic nucleotide-binding domain (CNMP-BD) protein OS=Rhodopirellula sp. SWK7 GN=RRSWK_03149 PE=4 SV=1: Fer2_4: Fer4_9: cNMP_binding: Fer4_7 [Gemmataceae bacterium]VTT96703.1 cyclic nucleotide-binding protein : Cyclic nucleotide-binding domain (CNMP-BD) protein OS=Rhodopirellula sp. SWK7 GN=RRSWK_03149 PE=4 SV=1: Fer2_4: Fer4_9: cNMP_binding: Fer4_7 [Gemmataceae bacterium]